jgi:hypothetical protein
MVGRTLFAHVRHSLDHLQRQGRRHEASGGPLLAHIHPGIEVVSAYGMTIGTITEIWRGQDAPMPSEPCAVDRCSRLQVQ